MKAERRRVDALDPVRLSVVIACYNGARTLGDQLAALARQSGGCLHEVVVSDNGSTDDSHAVATAFAGRLPLRVVDASGRPGTGHARNAGMGAVTGNAIAILDQDDVVDDHWLEPVTHALRTHEFIATRRDGRRLNPAWAQEARTVPQASGLIEGPFLPHAGGCSLAFRRSVLGLVHGFDETFRFLDDVDFCYRAQLRGVTLHFCRDALLHYRLRHTLRGIHAQARNYAEESVLIYKEYLPHGMPPAPPHHYRHHIRRWLNLVRRVPLSKGGIAARIWEFGWLHGYLRGCLKYRTVAP